MFTVRELFDNGGPCHIDVLEDDRLVHADAMGAVVVRLGVKGEHRDQVVVPEGADLSDLVDELFEIAAAMREAVDHGATAIYPARERVPT